jgi:hypothetical protein
MSVFRAEHRPGAQRRRCTGVNDAPVGHPPGRPRGQATRESASSSTETAAAPVTSSPSSCPKMWMEATSVWNGTLPEMSTTAPNSPIARAKPSAPPERIAGAVQHCDACAARHERPQGSASITVGAVAASCRRSRLGDACSAHGGTTGSGVRVVCSRPSASSTSWCDLESRLRASYSGPAPCPASLVSPSTSRARSSAAPAAIVS